jgi:phospholipid transport system transporter-binding protein
VKPTVASLEERDGRWFPAGALVMDTVAALLSASRARQLPAARIVDLTSVARIDSAGVALMLAWKRRAAAEGGKLGFEHVPSTVTSLAIVYGVAELLDA